MASQIFKRGPTTPQMNITPLIDVVFLLIIFFMLVTNIIAKVSVKMMVPKLDDPKTEALGEVDRIVVSIAPIDYRDAERTNNPLLFDGDPMWIQVGLRRFSPQDLESVTEALLGNHQANPQAEVLLRADGALYYEGIEPVMAAITAAGISKVNLVAMMPENGPSYP